MDATNFAFGDVLGDSWKLQSSRYSPPPPHPHKDRKQTVVINVQTGHNKEARSKMNGETVREKSSIR